MTLDKIRHSQKEFQRSVDLPVDSLKEDDMLRLSEMYIFKTIEELIELRKEFPSVINPWSKDQKQINRERILEELSDVVLFLCNFANVWKFHNEEIIDSLHTTQTNNFNTLKTRKLNRFNASILNTPGYTVGLGQGNINPKYVFIGQNPGQGITNGYKVWSDRTSGSSKKLLPALELLGILNDCYFTNLVKCTTPNNEEPTDKLVEYWFPKLQVELSILMINNPDTRLVLMGSFVKNLMKAASIRHPAYILRQNISIEDYAKEIQEAIK